MQRMIEKNRLNNSDIKQLGPISSTVVVFEIWIACLQLLDASIGGHVAEIQQLAAEFGGKAKK